MRRKRANVRHNEGWLHNKESGDDLAAAFNTLGVGDRLTNLERGKPTRFEWRV
jgi:hypothetical protein